MNKHDLNIRFFSSVFLKLSAEERTDSRVVDLEVAARKLDKKVVAEAHSECSNGETA